MAENTAIEWTHREGTTPRTWNPTTGCDRLSAGCDHCYALTLAKRLKGMGSPKYQADGDPRTSGPGFGVATHADTLADPLKWRKPSTVFVNSMSDLFHARVPRAFVARVFAVMAATPQHTYQILTKRPERMARMLVQGGQLLVNAIESEREAVTLCDATWPLPNVWLGTSIESAEHVGRADHLRRTPALQRFVSAEPLLGPLDALNLDGISWLIAGGESGHGARPLHPDWLRSLRDQCAAADVAFFLKQWGEYGQLPQRPTDLGVTVANDGTVYQSGDLVWPDGPRVGEAIRADHGHAHLHAMYRVGKKFAGRELDGRTHDDYPKSPAADVAVV